MAVLVGPVGATMLNVGYTGNAACAIDLGGYGNGAGMNMGGRAYLGGSASNSIAGVAYQFNLSGRMDIDYLLASVSVQNNYSDDGTTEGMLINFVLYDHTSTFYHSDPNWAPFPYNEILLTSMYVTTTTETVYYPELGISHTFTRDGEYHDVPLLFDITLEPGTYWIAMESSEGYIGGPSVTVSARFASDSAPVPEPSSFILLGAGLSGLAIWRRKKSKNLAALAPRERLVGARGTLVTLLSFFAASGRAQVGDVHAIRGG